MITSAYYPEYSGAATQCHSLSKKLLDKGCKVIVVTYTKDANLLTQEWIDGIDVRRIHVREKGFTGLVTALRLLFVLIKEIREFKIIHFHGFNNHLLWVVWFGSIFRKKVIMKISMMEVDNTEVMMNRGLFHRIVYKHFDKIVATTSVMMKEFQEYPSLNTIWVHIPNGVDTDLFHPVNESEKTKLKSQLGLPISRKIIIFNGIICMRKGIDILLSAWQSLKQELNELCPLLLLVGPFESDIWKYKSETDQLKKRIMVLIKKYPNEVFHFRMKQEIEFYYKAADIFVLPSRNEGLPNALLEAMSSGLACIIMENEGHQEVINNKIDGIIFKYESAVDLKINLLEIVQNEEKLVSLQKSGRMKVKKLYNINEVAYKYRQLYNSLI